MYLIRPLIEPPIFHYPEVNNMISFGWQSSWEIQTRCGMKRRENGYWRTINSHYMSYSCYPCVSQIEGWLIVERLPISITLISCLFWIRGLHSLCIFCFTEKAGFWLKVVIHSLNSQFSDCLISLMMNELWWPAQSFHIFSTFPELLRSEFSENWGHRVFLALIIFVELLCCVSSLIYNEDQAQDETVHIKYSPRISLPCAFSDV